MAVTGALLLTVVAAGISMYRTDTTPKRKVKHSRNRRCRRKTAKM